MGLITFYRRHRLICYGVVGLAGLLVGLILLLNLPFLMRSPRTYQQQELFQGVVYQREPRVTPRPLMVHVITLTLTTPGISLLVTPGDKTGGMDLLARTTGDFLTEFNLQVAINGGYFEPFWVNGVFDYYPYPTDPVDVTGLAMSNGVIYSVNEVGAPVLCISANNRVQITEVGCPANTVQALAGGPILINYGQPVSFESVGVYDNLHPRTVVATDRRGEKLWLIVVDGRQPGYSEGVTLVELADIVAELGAYQALNLDGGGSTTLVSATHGAWWSNLLNAPIHTRIPMRQRPVANHLGVYALPINNYSTFQVKQP